MNIKTRLGEYILQTHNTNFFGRFNGGFELPPNPPLGMSVLLSLLCCVNDVCALNFLWYVDIIYDF